MDHISTSTLIIILSVLIVISAFFSSSETGMMSLNKYRLRHRVLKNNRSAIRVQKLLNRPDRLIGLILIGNNLVNIAAAQVAGIIGTRLYGEVTGMLISAIALTIVLLLFAEVTPKTIAAWFPEKVAYPASVVLTPLLFLLYPFVISLNFITNGFLKLFKIKPSSEGTHVLNQDELRTVVNEAGTMIPRQHQDMLLSILDLEKVTVEDIMVPRTEILGIDINDDWKDVVKQLTHGQHTRLLVYRDTMDDAVGFIHARDVLRMSTKKEFNKETIMRCVKEISYIPEGTPLNKQLLRFQKENNRLSLIVDEYGDIQGLITLENILEEIVGDFAATTTPEASDDYIKQSDNTYVVEGSANIRDLAKDLGWELPIDGPRTVNGLILEYLEEIPKANVSIKLYGYPVDIIDVKDNVIKQVKFHPELKKS